MLRSSLIGTWVGILPGVGASIGSVIAYTTTKNLSKSPERFGHGAEEGSSPRRRRTTPPWAVPWYR
jgi:putative tricarboxylic transport membrane protein